MINKHYLTLIEQVAQAMEQEFPSVSLQQFLEEDVYEALVRSYEGVAFTQYTFKLKHSFKLAEINDSAREILNSDEVIHFLSAVLGKPVLRIEADAYKFTHRDYTILHDDDVNEGVDFVLDLTQEWDPNWGGSVIYVDKEGEYRAISPAPNTLTLTRRDGVRRFVHYLNHYAKERFLIMGKVLFVDGS